MGACLGGRRGPSKAASRGVSPYGCAGLPPSSVRPFWLELGSLLFRGATSCFEVPCLVAFAMGPKRSANQLPKACADLKEALNGNVTADALADPNLATLRNRAFGGMRNALASLHVEKAAEFRRLESDAERRAWLAEYLLDPKSGGCVGKNWTSRTTKKTDEDKEVWATQSMLEGPMFFNCPKVTAIAIKGMESRPHKDNPALREAGILEYKFIKGETTTAKTLEEGASAEQTCAIDDPEDYVAVRAHMAEPSNPGRTNPADAVAKRRRTNPTPSAPPEPPSPEDAKLKDLRSQVTKSVQGMKSTYDRIQRDLSQVAVIEGKLKAKSWDTQGPLNYLKEQTAEVTNKSADLFTKWTVAKQFDLASEKSEEVLVAQKNENDTNAKETLDAYKKYAKEVLSEFARMK